MPFNPNLEQGAELINEQLCNLFGVSPQGGMRRSLKNDALVLISNRVESLYKDRFVDGVIHYTGMGQIGNQDLNAAQNKTLKESLSNGKQLQSFSGGSVRKQPLIYKHLSWVNVKLPKIVTKLRLVFGGAHSVLLEILNFQVGYCIRFFW